MTRRRQLIVLGLFVAAGFGLFSTILTSYFLSDDFVQIGKVLNGDFSVVWGKAHGGFFRPLFVLNYIIDAKLWGARPLGFHITNVAFHSANAFFVFLLSFRLLEYVESPARARHSISIIAGALFPLPPLAYRSSVVDYRPGGSYRNVLFPAFAPGFSFISPRAAQFPAGRLATLFCAGPARERIRPSACLFLSWPSNYLRPATNIVGNARWL